MSATIVKWTPDPTGKIYQNSRIVLTATITNQAPLTGNEYVQISFPSGSAFSLDLSTTNASSNAYPDIDPNDPKTGTWFWVVNVSPTATAANLTFKVGAGAFTITNPNSAYPATATVAPPLAPMILGPTKPWMDIPPSTLPNPLLPGNSAAAPYMTTVTAAVTDGSTPVANYVIDWYETPLGGQLQNIFTSKLYTYVNRTATRPIDYTDRWPVGPLGVNSTRGQFIRTVTGADGTATFYIVANNQNGAAVGGHAIADLTAAPQPGTQEDAGTFLVTNTHLSNPPAITNLQLAPTLGTTDFDIVGNTVPVIIPLNDLAQPGDPIFTFINGKFASAITWSSAFVNDSSYANFPALLGYTGAGNENMLEFTWVPLTSNDPNFPLLSYQVSRVDEFLGIGQPKIVPTPGTLEAPFLYTGITDATLAIPGAVRISVPLITNGGWRPAPTDIITVSAFIKGFDSVTGNPKKDYVSSVSKTISTATTVLSFSLDPDKFRGYGRSGSGESSYVYFNYTVVTENRNFLSRVLQGTIRTSA